MHIQSNFQPKLFFKGHLGISFEFFFLETEEIESDFRIQHEKLNVFFKF
jgi:hypothetical protein